MANFTGNFTKICSNLASDAPKSLVEVCYEWYCSLPDQNGTDSICSEDFDRGLDKLFSLFIPLAVLPFIVLILIKVALLGTAFRPWYLRYLGRFIAWRGAGLDARMKAKPLPQLAWPDSEPEITHAYEYQPLSSKACIRVLILHPAQPSHPPMLTT